MGKFNSDNLYILYWENPEYGISFRSIEIYGVYINEEEALEDQRLYNKDLLYKSYRGVCCARIVKNYKYEYDDKDEDN